MGDPPGSNGQGETGTWANSGALVLLGVQLLVCTALLGKFFFGTRAFAYRDIGSDTSLQFTPYAIQLANYLRRDGWPGWSFEMGLGQNLAPLADPFTLLNAAFGAEHVLVLRAWVYGLKLVLAGGLFYRFLLAGGARRAVAVPVALAYSFCGYALIDGQWDPFATELVVHALVLWAIARQLRSGGRVLLPVATAAAFLLAPFFFSLAVFVALLAAATLLGARERRPLARRWLVEIGPLLAAGVLLAAPRLLPIAIQLRDSDRVSGALPYLAGALSLNDAPHVMAQLAGLFHKDILARVPAYAWENYLESPGFFVGVLPLLLIPQLWSGERRQRRALGLGLAGVALYVLSPFVRRLAYGFQLDYFRVSTLWVAILLLVLHALALGRVLEHGVDRRLLGLAAGVQLALLATVSLHFGPRLQMSHVLDLALLTAVALAFLGWQGRRLRARRGVVAALVAFVACEAVVIGYPSLVRDRWLLSKRFGAYRDGTEQALAVIRASDSGAFRVEKTYDSFGQNDALVQGYAGVKSYTQQNGGTVAFFRGLGLRPEAPGIVNYTNWLPNFGARYMLNSAVGVRYIISRGELDWPGYAQLGHAGSLRIYRNELALDLGAVYDAVLPRSRFLALPERLRDVVLLHAAVVEDGRIPDGIRIFDPAVLDATALDSPREDRLEADYAAPARTLQRRGLKIARFTNKAVGGVVESDVPGLLVVTIPQAPGWTVRVDGEERPIQRVQLGMIGVAVGAGRHSVELRHRLPGLPAALLLALLGAVAWMALARAARTRRPQSRTGLPCFPFHSAASSR